MTEHVKVSGFVVTVVEAFKAEEGDRILIVNGKCLGLYTAEVKALPAPARKQSKPIKTGRPAGRGGVMELALQRIKKWGPLTAIEFVDKSGAKGKEERGAMRATLMRLVRSDQVEKFEDNNLVMYRAKEE